LCEGGLSPEGTGIRTAQKVRLMHASIRYFIRQAGDWDAQVLGEPINQEDMAGTLMDFAVYPLEGMEQIGMDLSDEEKEGYYHVWRIIGHVMGVNPALIPPNFAEGSILGHAILDHQKRGSEAGRELTTACIDFLERITPGTLFDFYPQILVRYLIGNELADMTGVRDYPDSLEHLLEKLTVGVFGRVDKALDRNGIISRLAKRFNIKLLEGMVNYFNNDKQINFYIPPSLQENWFPKEREESWNNLASTPDIAGYRLALQKRTKF
jgi:hypothetical protein